MSLDSCKVLVVCGPSGSGKSSLLQRLFADYPSKLGFSVSHTTRNPRQGEENGVHYHFTTREKMTKMIEEGHFLESATYSSNTYGTSIEAVEVVNRAGKFCVLDIEVEGVKQVKQKECLEPILIFVQPPSHKELEKRLRERGTETEESLLQRLNTAKVEMEYGRTPGNFDLILVNDDLEKSYEELKTFLKEEFLKRGMDLDDES